MKEIISINNELLSQLNKLCKEKELDIKDILSQPEHYKNILTEDEYDRLIGLEAYQEYIHSKSQSSHIDKLWSSLEE